MSQASTIIASLGNFLPLIAVGSLMFSMGMGLFLKDFKSIVRKPKAAILGFTGQVIILPLVGLLIAVAFRLPPHIAVGLMIIAACPGGATSNAFSVLVKGDMALSITLTALSSLIAFITLPLIVNFSLGFFNYGDGAVSLSFAKTATQVFSTTAVPVVLGMLVRLYAPKIADKIIKPLFYFGFLCLVLPVFIFLKQFASVVDLNDIVPATSSILLNITMMCVGAGMGMLAGLAGRQNRTLAVEVGIQNFGLVLVVIVTFLGDFRLLLPALLYLPSMYLTAFILSFLARNSADGIDVLKPQIPN